MAATTTLDSRNADTCPIGLMLAAQMTIAYPTSDTTPPAADRCALESNPTPRQNRTGSIAKPLNTNNHAAYDHAFPAARPPGAGRGYAYALVIKGDEQRKALAEYAGRSEVVGATARSSGFVAIGNRRATFEYRVEVDPMGVRGPVETLSINGQPLEVGKGRVVLIDLSAPDVSWKQVGVGLPASPAYPEGAAQVESQAKGLLGQLRRDSAEAREFLK